MASDVTLTNACPACGNEATWIGSVNEHTGTDYTSIECPKCDGWTWLAQLQRRKAAA